VTRSLRASESETKLTLISRKNSRFTSPSNSSPSRCSPSSMSSSSMTSTSNPPSKPRPTLPTELVEDILAQDSLSKVDLARCCLVSRQFLHPARQSLYATLHFTCHKSRAGAKAQYVFNTRSLHLLSTLRRSPALCSLVVALYCDSTGLDPSGVANRKEVTENLKELLEILPRVHQLLLLSEVYRPLRAHVVSQASRWTVLKLARIDGAEALTGVVSFPKLKKLICQFLPGDSDFQPLYFPSKLTHLSFNRVFASQTSIPDATSSPLEFFRLKGDDFLKLPDVLRLPRLHRLELQDLNTYSNHIRKVSEIISRCQHLTSLSLSISSPSSSDLHSLLKCLPKPLARLDFPDAFPLDSLKILLTSETLDFSLRTIGFLKKGSEDEEDPGVKELASFARLCASKGIEIEYISRDHSLLGASFSPFCLFSILGPCELLSNLLT